MNNDARKFSVARSVADASGIDLTKLPAFLKWTPAPGLSGGGQWLPSATQPTSGIWLVLLPLTSTVVSYSLPAGQVLPYSTVQFDTICWDGRGMLPNTSCTDAACALGRMPVGTVVSIIQWPEVGQTLDYSVSIVNLGGAVTCDDGTLDGGRVLDELYPWLFISVDGTHDIAREPGATLSTNDLTALGDFNVRARGFERHTGLPLSAETRVRGCFLIPPGFHLRQKQIRQVG